MYHRCALRCVHIKQIHIFTAHTVGRWSKCTELTRARRQKRKAGDAQAGLRMLRAEMSANITYGCVDLGVRMIQKLMHTPSLDAGWLWLTH